MKQYQINVTFGFDSRKQFEDFCKKFEDFPAEIQSYGLIEVEE